MFVFSRKEFTLIRFEFDGSAGGKKLFFHEGSTTEGEEKSNAISTGILGRGKKDELHLEGEK